MTISTTLQCGRFALDLRAPLIMGIVNVTPDSFSDGGRFMATDQAVSHALQLVEEGADLLDIGGESTRPGAQAVSEDEEIRRVVPVIEALLTLNVPLSVDTMKPGVMRAAIAAGADLVNDVNALQADGAMEAVAGSRAAVCLMHMQGQPATMQQAPSYGDAVSEVEEYLLERASAAQAAGIDAERIVLDPGFGFGKTLDHNLALFRELPRLVSRGYPVLAGVSRKSMLGAITGRPVDQRLHASVAAALMAAERGARILRVHDVAATCDAIKIWKAVNA